MMTTLARVGFPIDETPLCALAAERVSEGADRSARAPLKPSARIGWRWFAPESAWRLARRPVGKALMLCTIYGFLAAMQDMQNRLPQCRTVVHHGRCYDTVGEQ